jgi:hypothetical protein
MARTVKQRPTCPRCGHAQDWSGLCIGCTDALVRQLAEHMADKARVVALRRTMA